MRVAQRIRAAHSFGKRERTMATKRKSPAEYEAIYNDLKRFYKFKFKIKKGGFRPQEKGLLSKLDKQLSIYTEGFENDTYTFVKGTKSQIRALKQIYHKKSPSALGKEQPKNKMVVTNKGVFIPQGKVKAKVDYTLSEPRITGKGKTTKIVVETPTRYEIFIPRRHGETIMDMFIRIQNEHPNITDVYVDVRGHKGINRYDPLSFTRYTQEVLEDIDNAIYSDGYDPPEVFTGLWIIAWKKHPQFE